MVSGCGFDINVHNLLLIDNGRSFMVTCFIDKNVVKRNQARPSYNAIKNEGTIAIPQL